MGFYLAERWPAGDLWRHVCVFLRRLMIGDNYKKAALLEWGDEVEEKITGEMVEAATGRKAGTI